MLNRRNAIKFGLLSPLLPKTTLASSKNRLENIANEIENKAVEALSKNNPIITTLKGVKIFIDTSLYEKQNICSFYGFVTIKLNNTSFHITHPIISDKEWTKKQIEDIISIINDNRSADYGFSIDIDEKLSLEEMEYVLKILRSKTNA